MSNFFIKQLFRIDLVRIFETKGRRKKGEGEKNILYIIYYILLINITILYKEL